MCRLSLMWPFYSVCFLVPCENDPLGGWDLGVLAELLSSIFSRLGSVTWLEQFWCWLQLHCAGYSHLGTPVPRGELA